MRLFHVAPDRFTELGELPPSLPPGGFVWIGTTRDELTVRQADIQERLHAWVGAQIVDLHVSDLLNPHLPSHYDYTSWYDLLVFRRLSAGTAALDDSWVDGELATRTRRALAAIDTSAVGFAVFDRVLLTVHPSDCAVGFAVFDRVLLTVHPSDCAVRDYFAQRLAETTGATEARGIARMPASPADLMLRMVNHMVDSYLELRRLLTRQFAELQKHLLDPRSHFNDWQVLLDSRNSLHVLEDTCEDQRAAVQEWLDALDEWPDAAGPELRRERELLRVRSRDVLEHVERVLTHVRRLEHSAETAVQMHFSALGHRTNDIMRTLTVLTAVFLPLNLITGFFGMNFDGLPLIHTETGVWIAGGMMLVIAVALGGFFWRRRYLGSSRRR